MYGWQQANFQALNPQIAQQQQAYWQQYGYATAAPPAPAETASLNPAPPVKPPPDEQKPPLPSGPPPDAPVREIVLSFSLHLYKWIHRI